MKKLIIHIGYPKTASTTLQLNLFGQMMLDNKIEYLNHLNENSDYLGDIYCRKILNYVMGMSDDSGVKEELENFKNITKQISLISNENLSFFSENFSWAYTSAKALDNINKIKNIFSPYFEEIHILIFIRAQVTMLPSYFAQQYNHIIKERPNFKNATKWLEANIYDKRNDEILFLNYNNMYDGYNKSFGKDYINICLFEDFLHNPKRIANKLSLLFEINEEYVLESITGNKKKNVTIKNRSGQISATSSSLLDRITYFYIKYLSKLISIKIAEKVKGLFIKLVPKQLLNIRFNNEINQLNEFEKNKIHEIYKESNLRLNKKIEYSYNQFVFYKYL